MTSTLYSVRYGHKIAPRDSDVGPDVALRHEEVSSRGTLAKALREAGILCSGDRVRSFRIENDGKIVTFPAGASVWHSIILTPKREAGQE